MPRAPRRTPSASIGQVTVNHSSGGHGSTTQVTKRPRLSSQASFRFLASSTSRWRQVRPPSSAVTVHHLAPVVDLGRPSTRCLGFLVLDRDLSLRRTGQSDPDDAAGDRERRSGQTAMASTPESTVLTPRRDAVDSLSILSSHGLTPTVASAIAQIAAAQKQSPKNPRTTSTQSSASPSRSLAGPMTTINVVVTTTENHRNSASVSTD